MARIATLSLVGVLTLAGSAAADTLVVEHPSATSYSWYDSALPSGIGVGMVLGGGIAGFTDASVRDTLSSNLSGLWDARIAIGTHVPIGLEVAYIGTGVDMNTLNGNSNGTLVGTTAEATLRYNILPHAVVNPYVFAGMGWQRYDLMNASFSTADTGVKASDDLLEIPMGVGISYRDVSGWLVDLRGTFRDTDSSTLVAERTGTYGGLDSWEASGALGYEF